MQPSISLSNFKYCEDIARLTITYKRKKEVAQCVYLEAACLIFHNTLTFEFLSDKIIKRGLYGWQIRQMFEYRINVSAFHIYNTYIMLIFN